MDRRIHLVIPMAGEGQRFRKAGIDTPKPLIDVGGVPMYQLILSNLWSEYIGRVTLIARAEYDIESRAPYLQKRLGAEVNVVNVYQTTGGPAVSVGLAECLLKEHEPVVVANSDQFVDANLDDLYVELLGGDISGSILTMEDDDPKWSYVEVDSYGHVLRVAEKKVISRYASVGIYGFQTAQLMLSAFKSMREAREQVNGEYYVAPAYNFMPRTSGPVVSRNLGPIRAVTYGLGTPEDLKSFTEAHLYSAFERARKFFP